MIDRLEALAKAATPGPWCWQNYETDAAVKFEQDAEFVDEGGAVFLRTTWQRESKHVGPIPVFIIAHADEVQTADAEFIAACDPDTILKLTGIVKDLAASQPRDHESDHCAICGDHWNHHTDPDCAWRRAVGLLGKAES